MSRAIARVALLAAGLLLVACGGAASAGASGDNGTRDASFDGADAGVQDARADAGDADAGGYTRPGPCLQGARCSVIGLDGTPDNGLSVVYCVCSQGKWSCQGSDLDALPAAYDKPQLPQGDFIDGGACQGVNFTCGMPGCMPVSCRCASNGMWDCQVSGPC